MCDDSDCAGTVDVPRALLCILDLEHKDYFSDEELERHNGAVHYEQEGT